MFFSRLGDIDKFGWCSVAWYIIAQIPGEKDLPPLTEDGMESLTNTTAEEEDPLKEKTVSTATDEEGRDGEKEQGPKETEAPQDMDQ